MNNNIKRTWKNLIHKMEVNLNTNLHFQFVYYLVLCLKISLHASRAQKASYQIRLHLVVKVQPYKVKIIESNSTRSSLEVWFPLPSPFLQEVQPTNPAGYTQQGGSSYHYIFCTIKNSSYHYSIEFSLYSFALTGLNSYQ